MYEREDLIEDLGVELASVARFSCGPPPPSPTPSPPSPRPSGAERSGRRETGDGRRQRSSFSTAESVSAVSSGRPGCGPPAAPSPRPPPPAHRSACTPRSGNSDGRVCARRCPPWDPRRDTVRSPRMKKINVSIAGKEAVPRARSAAELVPPQRAETETQWSLSRSERSRRDRAEGLTTSALRWKPAPMWPSGAGSRLPCPRESALRRAVLSGDVLALPPHHVPAGRSVRVFISANPDGCAAALEQQVA
ncbi:hypothetical protein Z043_105636 [Scleropages formosus]|uniref:Uncharacterized protein n=1 Tax=Scleropages formosus TaxID=113540 RepID=A0A0P7XJA6_SCLFO|nr:hypothetical protein Z043_105636 [Scleropages formosus]